MVPVRVIGPSGDRDVLGRADSGSDDTLLPQQLAVALGVTSLTDPVPMGGVGGGNFARFGTVDLEIGDGKTVYRWSAYVGFSPHPLPLLGLKGFLQFFTAAFNGRRRHLDLVPNGTAVPPSFLGP
jgi:hypothetical protein